jgi:hypothetical protein
MSEVAASRHIRRDGELRHQKQPRTGWAAPVLAMTAHREQAWRTARAVSRKRNTALLGFGITRRL